MNEDRLKKLEELLDAKKPDPFLLYAIALEHKSRGHKEKSIEFLLRLLAIDEGYLGAYYQITSLYAETAERSQAEFYYNRGIKMATEKGDQHALRELKQAYSTLTDED